MPPPHSHNRFSCLSIDEIPDDKLDCVKDVQESKRPKVAFIQRARWEQHLPKKYIIASTSKNSLNIDVEIETTDTSVKRHTDALVDSGATGLFMDTVYVHANNISTRQLSYLIPVFNVDGLANEA